jgi:FMN-dependent NADH-azoreductase
MKGSTSRALAKKLLDKIKKPGDEILYRDLDEEMLFVSGLTESGMHVSTSRALAKKLLDKIKKPGDEILYRDLDEEMLFVSGLTESGMHVDEKDQTEHHKKMFELSDKLVKELKESDIIIISAPIYNYGPPATLKAWSDLAARIGETFKFKPNGRREGLLKNKHAYLVITSGGTKLNVSPILAAKSDHALSVAGGP